MSSNLSGKNVLVTGSGGFIGSHLTEELIRMGCNVTSFVRYNSMSDWEFIDTFPEAVESPFQDTFAPHRQKGFGEVPSVGAESRGVSRRENHRRHEYSTGLTLKVS